MVQVRRSALLRAMKESLGRERQLQVLFLEALGEFDAREWYSDEAYSSSFAFLTTRLKLCENAAWRRLATARAARRFPQILDLLRRGRVHMTGIALVATKLDDSNIDFILRSIAGKTRLQIEEFVADLASRRSKSDKRTSPGRRGRVSPLGDRQWKLEVYGDDSLKDLVDEAMELAPARTDLSSVVEDALRLYVRRRRNRKVGADRRARSSGGVPGSRSASVSQPSRRSRHIPAHVRRLVFERDGGQCRFVDGSGRRCSERRQLEFDHLVPFCLGGAHSVENLRLCCRAHNRHAARERLGRDVFKFDVGSLVAFPEVKG